MEDPFDKKIAEVNRQLKLRRNPITLERRGSRLWGRATLPPKPHKIKERSKPYQQRFNLRLPANQVGIAEAYRIITRIGGGVSLGEFDWYPWLSEDIKEKITLDGQPNIRGWIALFEERYWLKHPDDPKSRHTWGNYMFYLRRLPGDEALTLDILIKAIAEFAPNTHVRRHALSLYSRLARFAGKDPSPLADLGGQRGALEVTPRTLPDDDQVVEVIDRLIEKQVSWAWAIAMLACYGLRNHEVFHLDLGEFPNIFVGPHTKSGRRYVYPPKPEWCDRWDLGNPRPPNIAEAEKPAESRNNALLGQKVTLSFRRNKLPFGPYDLRHAFGRRCFEAGYPPDLAAQVMGHSLDMHMSTYRAWWGEETYRRAYDRVMLENLI